MPRKLYVGPGLPRDLQARRSSSAAKGARARRDTRSAASLARAPQERDLEDVFYKYGKLTNIWIARNPPGFAYVVSRPAAPGPSS
jgi:hypothetical protein